MTARVSMFAGIDAGRLAGLQGALAAAVLASVYAFQHLGGLQPCVLCLYQRWPWWIALGLCAAAALLRGRRRAQTAAVALASLTILTGAGIAVFHVGVEQQWWPGLASCGGVGGAPLTLEALKQQILSAPVVRCDEVAWSFLGISMAGYNAMISAAAGAAGLAILWRERDMRA